MSLPPPTTVLRRIAQIAVDVITGIILVIVTSSRVQWALVLIGAALVAYQHQPSGVHHWIMGTVLMVLGLGGAAIASSVGI